MVRRIDALHFKRQDVRAKVAEKTEQMRKCKEKARQKINDEFAKLFEDLQARKQALLQDVDNLAAQKLRTLDDQIDRVEQFSVRSGNSDALDGVLMRLRTDEVVDFKPKKMKELQELMLGFGIVDGTSTYASESYAVGPLIEGPAKVGVSTWLLVKACDLHGKQRKEGGDKLTVKFSDDDVGPSHFTCDVKDLENGCYRVNVVPEAVGSYKLRVGFENPDGSADEQIQGSCFEIGTVPPFDYTILGDDTLGQAGNPWTLDEVGFLKHPIGIQFDPCCDFIFVADQSNHRVQVFSYASREVVCSFGKRGCGASHFDSPGYIVVDRASCVIVSDMLNHRLQILHFNRSACALSLVRSVGSDGNTPGKFRFPRGVAMTQSGLLAICDSGNHRIQLLDSTDGFAFVREFGTYGEDEGKLDKPFDVAINSKDEILVTDDRHRVQIFDLQGGFLRSFGTRGRKNGQFRHATSLTVDDEGGIFVCDQGNHRVQVFSSQGVFLHKWGGYLKKIEQPEGDDDAPVDDEGAPTPLDDAFWYGMMSPSGITVSPSGTVLVSDFQKDVVFDFSCGASPIDETSIFQATQPKSST